MKFPTRILWGGIRVMVLFITLACVCNQFAHAQSTDENISLTITDRNGQALPYATVIVESAGLTYTADAQGRLRLKTALFTTKGTRLTVSYLGKATRQLTITHDAVAKEKKINIALDDNNLYLKDVQVNATRAPRHSNSSMLIQRNTIDNIQAYSLADIVQALPGKAILNTDMHNASFLTLRSALQGDLQNPLDAYSRNKLNDYVRNAAFGIAYVVDGTPLSNNTNMQLDSYGKWGGIKMFDRRFNTDNNENVGSGNDLRLIPASSIESVEVISGVAPAKYGDLSNGAVIINRRAGLTPFYGSVKVQYDIFNASLGKGFALGERWGMLNLNIDYLHSTRDRRDKLKTNANIALNATWTHTISRALAWENTLSADFSKNVDGLKSDPDATLNRTRTDQQNLRLALRGALSPQQNGLIDGIDHVDPNRILNLARQGMANAANFTFVFVGHFQRDSLLALVCRYIGSLPASNPPFASWQPALINEPSPHHQAAQDSTTPTTTTAPNNETSLVGTLRSVQTYAPGIVCNHFRHAMTTPKANAYIVWWAKGTPYTLANIVMAEAVGQLLGMRYTQRIREEMGAAYSTDASCTLAPDVNTTYLKLYGICPMKPELVDSTLKAMRAEAENMARNIAPTLLENVKRHLAKRFEERTKQNSTWLRAVQTWAQQGIDIHTNYLTELQNITPQRLQQFVAHQLMAQGNRVEVVMLPE